MKKRKKVDRYLNPELPSMETNLPLQIPPNIVIPKSLEDCKNAAERVLYSCVKLFTTPDPLLQLPHPVLNDPYDQTIMLRNRAIRACSINNIPDLAPSGDGACEAFERDLNAMENMDTDDFDIDRYIDTW